MNNANQTSTPAAAFEALRTWRESALALNTPNILQLKLTHLRLVANSKFRTESEIRGAFPPIIGTFAGAMAQVLVGVSETALAPEPDLAAAETTPAADPAVDGQALPPILASIRTPPAAIPRVETDPDVQEDWEAFSPYEFGPAEGTPTTLRLSRMADQTTRIVWPLTDGAPLYRVVTSDRHAPYSPDKANRVSATSLGHAVDTAPFTHAVRHYQVWRNDGVTKAEAMLAQPTLHSEGALVSPVLDLEIREDEGRVIGQWHVLPGTERVQVFRIPRHSAATGANDPSFRILAHDDNLGGFVDLAATRGEDYLYQVCAQAEANGVARLSSPTVVEMTVSTVHEPVVDLSFYLQDDLSAPLFDLAWTTPPGGKAVIYRTRLAPVAGIERSAQQESVLGQAGLTPDDRLAHPIAVRDGQSTMKDVPWPREWTRAYFTAVVLQDGKAYVGNTVRGVRVPPITRPKITERVNRQLVTFEWPEGADVVEVYRGPTGGDPLTASQGEPIEISQSDYQEQGGVTFKKGVLPSGGCDLHLVSVAFDGGQKVLAAPVTLHYPRILRLSYTAAIKRTFTSKQYAVVNIKSEWSMEHPPPFVLVYNPKRLPLTLNDGLALAVVRNSEEAGDPTRRIIPGSLSADASEQVGWRTHQASWHTDVAKPTGFIRLFVDLPPAQLAEVALIDPPVSDLRVMTVLEQAQGVFGG